MTFYAVLEQVIVLLQRHGRVSYRALQRQFNLDEAFTEDLKTELIEVQQLACDEQGRILVWVGPHPPDVAPRPRAVSTPEAVTPAAPHQASAMPSPSSALRGERRQVTILFADLSGFTALAEQMDPEAVRNLINACFARLVPIIEKYEGTVDKFIGDEIMAVFGAPIAHEYDAERAVRTALEMMAALAVFNAEYSRDLGLHCGINTGLVIAGGIGTDTHQAYTVIGDAVNLAARLEDASERGQIFVGSETYRLTSALFTFERLELLHVKGKAEPVQVYRVLGASDVQSRMGGMAQGLTPLVGRASEVLLLLDRWHQAKGGRGQVVLVSGEAGIGKSRLVQELKDHVTPEPHTWFACRGSPYYQNTALYPITDGFQRALQWHSEDAPDQKLHTLEQTLSQYRLPLEDTVPLFASLVSLPLPEERYPPRSLAPQRQRQKTLESLVAILRAFAEHQPVLFVLEDLHWVDPTTLEWLTLFIEQTTTACVLSLLTVRPAFQPPWRRRSSLTQVALNRLSRPQTEQMITQVAGGKGLPAEVLQQIATKTDGVPLFIEELSKAILESGFLKETTEGYALTGLMPALIIPTTLQESLMARLDRLATAKEIAQLGATIGRQFSYEVLEALAPLDATVLQQELRKLVDAELLYQRGIPPHATYLFKHALVQDAAYQSLLKGTRQQYHQRIAHILETQFSEAATLQPELLAHHYTEAGLSAPAVGYWHQASQRAMQRSAYAEAIRHLTKGLELIPTIPDTPERIQHELGLQIVLGAALMATKGQAASEVERVYTRARELGQQVGDMSQLFPVLFGLWGSYEAQGKCQTACEVAEQLLIIAQHLQDSALLLEAHHALGATLFWLGEVASARAHLEQGITLYTPQQHFPLTVLYGEDPGIVCRSYAARALWFLGYPDQALQRSHDALALAQTLAHPFSLAYARTCAAALHLFRREGDATAAQAVAAIAISTEQGLPYWVAWGMVLQGWALAACGHEAEGLAQMRQGLAAYQGTGAELLRPYFLVLLAEVYGNVKQTEEGLRVLAEALALIHQHDVRFYEAEGYRLQGELLLRQVVSDKHQAETCFHQALAIARHQQVKSLELRAAMSLSRLWQQQEKRDEALELLTPVYNWFTEGFDTADLQEAHALLEALKG